MASPEPVFVPRVFISPYGSVAIQEPGGSDYYWVARIGPDVQSVTMVQPGNRLALPGEYLVATLRFQEMVPRGY